MDKLPLLMRSQDQQRLIELFSAIREYQTADVFEQLVETVRILTALTPSRAAVQSDKVYLKITRAQRLAAVDQLALIRDAIRFEPKDEPVVREFKNRFGSNFDQLSNLIMSLK